jgi:hypothetical protein
MVDYSLVFSTLPSRIVLSSHVVVPLEILQCRLVKKGNRAVPQVLIRWSHVSPEAITWEDYNVLRECYPHAPAWGQAGIAGGADVMPAGAMGAIAEEDDLDSEEDGDEA